MLSPIVKVSTVLVRHNAVDKNSLYLVNTSQNGAQIYDLVAASPAERKLWCKHISEAAEAYKARDKQGRRPTPPTTLPEEPGPTIDDTSSTEHDIIPEKADQEQEPESEPEPKEPAQDTSVEHEADAPVPPAPDPPATEQAKQQPQPQQQQPPQPQSSEPAATGVGEPLRMVTCTQVSLIDPLEVHVEVPPVHVAEPVLTPIECLRRKDEIIKQALIEKQLLVADILNIPKEDFEHVADMASEPSSIEKEPAELILAAISQANQLVGMLNSALNVSETDTVLASRGASALTAPPCCEATGCPSPRMHLHPQQPAVPASNLQPVCHSLTSQLSQLLEIIKGREEERERLRKELRRSRERLHALDADIQRREFSETCTTSSQTQTEPGDVLNKESSIDDASRDEFVDARGESEANEEVKHAEHETETEVMGDSVG